MHLSASWDLYWLPPRPSPVGALMMCPGIWSSLREIKEPFCLTCRQWILTTLAGILTDSLSSSLLNLGKPLCIQALSWQAEGVNGNLSLPSLPSPEPKGRRVFPKWGCQCPASSLGSSPGKEAQCLRVAGGRELSRISVNEATVSEERALQGSAPAVGQHRDKSHCLTFTLTFCFWNRRRLSCWNVPLQWLLSLHFLVKIENKWWTGRMLEGPCCHWELRLNGHFWLWAWFDFVLLEGFHFQTEFSPGNTGDYTWTGWVCPAALPYTIRLCPVTILGIQSSQPPPPCAVGELRCAREGSPVPALSLPQGQRAGSAFWMCVPSPHPMEWW